MTHRISPRLLLALVTIGLVATLSGCVAYPAYPAYGYGGPYYGGGYVGPGGGWHDHGWHEGWHDHDGGWRR